MFLHVTSVKYLKDYKLELQFNDGSAGIVDLEDELYGEIFEPLQDTKFFQKVFLTDRTIEWPNGADIAPEYLYFLSFKGNLELESKFKKWGYIK